MTAKTTLDLTADSIRTAGFCEPLPLTTFEKFLWRSDTAQIPMVFRVMMRLDGTANRQLLQEAFDLAVARHPLLNSVVQDQSGIPVWNLAQKPPQLQWETPEQAA